MPTPANRPELTQYLPPDLAAAANRQLADALLGLARNPEFDLLKLFGVLVTAELNFRSQVIPVGEIEVADFGRLTDELRQQIGEAGQSFTALATQADDNELLAARGRFTEQIADFQQRLSQAETVGGKTQELVEALTNDATSARAIKGSIDKLEGRGLNLPAIVAGAVLRELLERGEAGIAEPAAADGQDLVTVSRQAVVESGSRRVELPQSAGVETEEIVVRVLKQRGAPRRVTNTEDRLNLKSLLKDRGIDTTGFRPIDFAHATIALANFTEKVLGVNPTPENIRRAVVLIVTGNASTEDLGTASSLHKLYGLGILQSKQPEQLLPIPPAEPLPSPKLTATPSVTHAKAESHVVEKPLYVMKPDDPLNQVFHFQRERWTVKRWGNLAAIVKGKSKKIDFHASGSKKALRRNQRDDVESQLREEIDAFVTACQRAGITTCQQVIERRERFRLTSKFTLALSQLGETPVTALNRLPGLIDLRQSEIKPQTRGQLFDNLRRRSR